MGTLLSLLNTQHRCVISLSSSLLAWCGQKEIQSSIQHEEEQETEADDTKPEYASHKRQKIEAEEKQSDHLPQAQSQTKQSKPALSIISSHKWNGGMSLLAGVSGSVLRPSLLARVVGISRTAPAQLK